ncbi:decapping 5 [Actinidia rufa]|uniref:Decapping 5 n=1 Tax=Actinidia rufa TaxID=165716 RepID=A0A7J0GZG1_9ERIC|nr:decapping 5 [Actinidia rufa]
MPTLKRSSIQLWETEKRLVKSIISGAPFGQHMKVEAMAIMVVELLLKLAQVKRMTLEQPLHPYELFVKTEMEKQQVVQTATTDQGLQVKVGSKTAVVYGLDGIKRESAGKLALGVAVGGAALGTLFTIEIGNVSGASVIQGAGGSVDEKVEAGKYIDAKLRELVLAGYSGKFDPGKLGAPVGKEALNPEYCIGCMEGGIDRPGGNPLPLALGGGGEGPHDTKFYPGWYKGKPPWKLDPGCPNCAVWELRSVRDLVTAEGKLLDVAAGRE